MARFLLSLLLTLPFCLQAQTQNCACCTEAHRQFHFWVGDWEAFGAQGKKLGENHIVLLQDSCVMQENWTSAQAGYSGTSYNYYDAKTEKWYQVWIDNQGSPLRLEGGMEDGKMVLHSGELTNAQGQTYRNRITWTPNDDGSVRQHWEITTDAGQNWKTLFDGIYRRKS